MLGQVAVDATSNEITAIPALLALLDLEGCTVTLDAMGCQTAIAQQIVDQGGDYVRAFKGNHGTLFAEVRATFALADSDPTSAIQRGVSVAEEDHGRIERRQVTTIIDAILRYLNPDRGWPALHSVVRVNSRRRIGEQVSVEQRYSLSSLAGDTAVLTAAIRGHWGIENRLHWVLDVAFQEDENRTGAGHAAPILATVRHLTLNLLRRAPVTGSIATRRFKAVLNPAILVTVLAGEDV